jgi:hypothetical protein
MVHKTSNPKLADQGNRGGKRGRVHTLSDASRHNLMLYLAKLNRDAPAFAMALTLPGDVQFLTSVKVHLALKTLCKCLEVVSKVSHEDHQAGNFEKGRFPRSSR